MNKQDRRDIRSYYKIMTGTTDPIRQEQAKRGIAHIIDRVRNPRKYRALRELTEADREE